jgi:hypothetical protein
MHKHRRHCFCRDGFAGMRNDRIGSDAASLNRPASVAVADIGLLGGRTKFATFEN